MTLPFNILPDSDAAKAVEEVRLLDLNAQNLDQQIAPILQKYNVDPVTGAAIGETARQIVASNPNIGLQPLAESLVGTAVADPRVAGYNAREAVRAGGNLSQSEQEELAVQAAGVEAEKAGGDKAVAEGKAKEALSQGASPEMAAQSAAAAAVSAAVANNAGPSGLEIFGYLKAMVKGVVIETIKGDERHEVTGQTLWDIQSGAFIQTTANDLNINCTEYHAEARHDVSRRSFAANVYVKGYYMESPSPWALTGLSASIAGASASAYAFIYSFGGLKTTHAKKDLYFAGIGMGSFEKTFESAHQRIDRTLVKIGLNEDRLLFLVGSPVGPVKSGLGSAKSKISGMFSKKSNSSGNP
ncbi:hypothetical protein [Bordetella sp. BOR01]|uniref:hypothetical protein n=1 Tax=Bordetella sp. BOR01 TaxID=2854779 RepID=UPI001C478DAF|nr:hypothetical protein [Bordetella sp. BOR01]MBV7481796.1 hypothetical protein [Bordetella sp. BOR01]